jgi:hypothetical protein
MVAQRHPITDTVPDFWECLAEWSIAQDGSYQQTSLALGKNHGYIAATISNRSWPRQHEDLRAILDRFNAPPARRAEWERLAHAHRKSKYTNGLLAQIGAYKPAMRKCAEDGCPEYLYERDAKVGYSRCRRHRASRGPGGPRNDPQNPLAHYADPLRAGLGLTREEFSDRCGMSRAWFSAGCQREVWHPVRRSLAAMASVLDVPVEELMQLAGGSDEDRRQAVWDATPADRRATRLRPVIAYRRSNEGRARSSLVMRLRRRALTESPSAAALRTQVMQASKRLKMEPTELLSYWRPLIREYRLLQLAPCTLSTDERCAWVLFLTDEDLTDLADRARAQKRKPANERRHRLIEEIRATWPTRQDRQAQDGLWDACVQACEAAGDHLEGHDNREKAERLARWHFDHCRRSCVVLDSPL